MEQKLQASKTDFLSLNSGKSAKSRKSNREIENTHIQQKVLGVANGGDVREDHVAGSSSAPSWSPLPPERGVAVVRRLVSS